MIVALDFETGGLLPSEHAPVSLATAIMEGEDIVASREWLFKTPTDKWGNPSRKYDPKAMEINGHDPVVLNATGAHIETVMDELTSWATEHKARLATVVAFNAPFDLAFYSECLFLGGKWCNGSKSWRVHKPPLVGPWHCARMVATVRLTLANYKLDTVAAHYGLARTSDTHGSLEDAVLAGRVFHRLTLK